MPRLPLVAIIGRPNTGKSTLFNRIIGKRRAIESSVAGTTRDHIMEKVEDEVDYHLIDTGGMGGGTEDTDFEDDVHRQSILAVQAADVIVFTLDGRTEMTKSDQEVIEILRRKRKRHVPVIIAVTKCDNETLAKEVEGQFEALGITDIVIPTSAAHGLGLQELCDAIVAELKKMRFENDSEVRSPNPESLIPRVAIIGKPNVGKSSLINALMSDPDRAFSPKLVSDIPGTTRDTTDTLVRHEGDEFLFIDTAGLRRAPKVEEGIEDLAVLRTMRALEESDVAVIMLDSAAPISKQDKRIANMAVDAGKGIILVMNKCDLLKGEARKEKDKEIRAAFLFCRFAPLLHASALTREGLLKLFPMIQMAHRNRLRRIPTKELQRWLEDTMVGKPVGQVRTTKHITQAKDAPPTFVLFLKNPKNVAVSQLRFLDNRLRETFGFEGTPVRWITKGPRDKN